MTTPVSPFESDVKLSAPGAGLAGHALVIIPNLQDFLPEKSDLKTLSGWTQGGQIIIKEGFRILRRSPGFIRETRAGFYRYLSIRISAI
jgi:hypothetical protein